MDLLVVDDGALVPSTAPTPVPGPGEVLIEVSASAINRADLLQVAGHYPSPPGAPSNPGLEVAGRVIAVGPEVGPEVGAEIAGSAPQVGDRVMALLAGGGYSSHVVAPLGQVLAVPDELTDVEAAALPEALATVWSNLVGVGAAPVGRLTAGESVLVVGAAGGIGTTAIQVARVLGARVVATARGPEKVAAVEALGADVVLDARTLDPAALTEAVLAATDGRGVDVVLDVLGGSALGENLRRLATGGRLVVIGTLEGRRGELDLGLLMQRRASVHGTTLRARPMAEKAAIMRDVATHLMPHVTSGALRPVIQQALDRDGADVAHRLLSDGLVTGKLVLTW